MHSIDTSISSPTTAPAPRTAPRIAFLYNNERSRVYEDVRAGRNHGVGFWGMHHLRELGIDAWFVELEHYVPQRVATFLRRYMLRSVYLVHLPLYFVLRRYDIVFTSGAFGTQLVHTLLGARRPRWVMHDFSITGYLGDCTTLKQRVFRYLVSHAAGIVTVGKSETEKVLVLFPHLAGRVEYIPFGVDVDFFAPQACTEEPMILGVGFDPDRDWETLLVAARTSGLNVTIATREKRIAHLRPLPENVHVVTFTPRELAAAYARAAVVVIPLDTSTGLNDAMGCSTLFEAMAAGKAIVATRTHTFESYIEDGVNGVLVPEKDASALAHELTRLMHDPVTRQHLGAAARTYACTHLDARVLAERLAAFMKRIVALP